MQSKFWRDRNAAVWRRTAALHDHMRRTAPKPGLRLYHVERYDHAIRMAYEWQHGLRQLGDADAG